MLTMVISVVAEWEKMAMGQPSEMLGDVWVSDARKSDVLVQSTPYVEFGDAC